MRGCRRRRHPVVPFTLLVVLAITAGCPETPSLTDGGRDAARRDQLPSSDVLGPDLRPTLAIGQYQDFDADAAGVISGSTPVNGIEQYLLILVSESDQPLQVHKYKVSSGSKQSMRLDQAPRGGRLDGSGRRGIYEEELARLRASRPTGLRRSKGWAAAGLPPKVGDKRQFLIGGSSGVTTITAEVARVDGVAAYWLDRTSSPAASIDDALLAALSDGFSKVAVPRLRTYYGKESDLDGDGTISLLFSPLVAESALAYFSPCDLVDTQLAPYCGPSSNQMEILYLTPPSSLKYGVDAPMFLATAAHELQHAIYFWHKYVLQNELGFKENPYVTEGLSALAEDLTGYHQSSTFYLTWTALDGIDQLSVPNSVSNAISAYIPAADSVMRGAGYLLFRYLFDRAGGDALDPSGAPVDKGGIAWLHSFVDGKGVDLATLAATQQLKPAELILQFWTALGLSNRGPEGAPINSDPLLNFRPTTTDPLTKQSRGCDLFAKTQQVSLSGPRARILEAADGELRGGGAEYLLVGAEPATAALTFRVETTAEAKAHARLVRLR